jgi:SAM-dependent methyltransferase
MAQTNGQAGHLSGHDVKWDKQKISDFWGIFSGVTGQQFFSRRAGSVFLDIAEKYLGHRVLDVGCGDGSLVREMRRRGYDATGTDPSPSGEAHLIRMEADQVGSLGEDTFDSVVSLETFEHVLPEELPAAFAAIAYILRPHGKFVFTVPLEENLQDEMCVCPDCHAIFHRWQHQQSFSRQSISDLLERAGLQPILFRGFELPFSLSFVPGVLKPQFARFWAWLRRRYHRKNSVLVVAQRRA